MYNNYSYIVILLIDKVHNKTCEVLTYTISLYSTAHCAAAESKIPLISPIAIFAPISTLDDFEGKE